MLALIYCVSILDKGVGWEGREKRRYEIKENRKRKKERKSERESKRDHQCWVQPQSSWWNVLGVRGDTFLWIGFSCQRRQISHFFAQFWKQAGGPGGVFGDLDHPPALCAHFLASSLPCAGLHLPPGRSTGKSAALPLHLPFSSHRLFFPTACWYQRLVIASNSCLSLPRALGWLHSPWAFGTHTLAPYLVGLHSGVHGTLQPRHSQTRPKISFPAVKRWYPTRFHALCKCYCHRQVWVLKVLFQKGNSHLVLCNVERLGGSRVSPVSYAVSCSRGKDAGTLSHFFIPVTSNS